jgi:hypothetical protein
MRTTTTTDLDAFLAALIAPAGPADLLEIRFRRPLGGMGQRFHTADDLDAAARVIRRLGADADVYVGVAPRAQRSGGRRAVHRSWTLWVDCDDHAAASRLAGYHPAPSIVVRSGSPEARHAYWLLDAPLAPDAVEVANRRLALAVGGDLHSTDAARILRPPGTRNFKHRPPAPVELEWLTTIRRPASVVLKRAPNLRVAATERPASRWSVATDDPLRHVPPERYVNALLGVSVPRNRKIQCPFHPDRTPSLHVYETPEGGWYCFGCGRGSSIYDLAAAVYGLGTRGADFTELRRRLTAALGDPRPQGGEKRRRSA